MNTILKKSHHPGRFWFDDFFTRDFDRSQPSTSSVSPSANIWEDEKNLYMEFAIPGVKKEDVKVKVENNTIQVSAEKAVKDEEKEKSFIRKEFHAVSYTRSFRINEKRYQVNAIEARLENGVLSLVVPKAIEEKKDNVHTVEVK